MSIETNPGRQKEILQSYWENERLAWLGAKATFGTDSIEARASSMKMDEYLDATIDLGLLSGTA